MTFDSTKETMDHIHNVRDKILVVISKLIYRSFDHDASKLHSPEKECFDKYTPMLRDVEYGSAKYKAILKSMDEGVRHHWAHNDHHAEFYPNGPDGMSLIALLEMICDWKAASERHATGDIRKSIEINEDRWEKLGYKMSPQLKNILLNTVEEMGW